MSSTSSTTTNAIPPLIRGIVNAVLIEAWAATLILIAVHYIHF